MMGQRRLFDRGKHGATRMLPALGYHAHGSKAEGTCQRGKNGVEAARRLG